MKGSFKSQTITALVKILYTRTEMPYLTELTHSKIARLQLFLLKNWLLKKGWFYLIKHTINKTKLIQSNAFLLF